MYPISKGPPGSVGSCTLTGNEVEFKGSSTRAVAFKGANLCLPGTIAVSCPYNIEGNEGYAVTSIGFLVGQFSGCTYTISCMDKDGCNPSKAEVGVYCCETSSSDPVVGPGNG